MNPRANQTSAPAEDKLYQVTNPNTGEQRRVTRAQFRDQGLEAQGFQKSPQMGADEGYYGEDAGRTGRDGAGNPTSPPAPNAPIERDTEQNANAPKKPV